MKRSIKALLSLVLAAVIAISSNPINSVAAKKASPVTISSSGYIKAVYARGEGWKKSWYSITTRKIKDVDDGYDVFDVRIVINRPAFSREDVVNTVLDMNRWRTRSMRDFYPVIIARNGGEYERGIRMRKYTLDRENSSGTITYKGKRGRTTYSLKVRSHAEYTFRAYVKDGKKNVYVGLAGLRAGQIGDSTYNRLSEGEIGYFKAGYGSSKSGYICAVRIS
ncbi:hypothetical protein [Butyrivibrio sp. JL13D10]|uniref:hypothetical protein n=1 Tax=Butyrivibrio sp. JL13D10 TaxID=3236815 RepID=UPI0038B47615